MSRNFGITKRKKAVTPERKKEYDDAGMVILRKFASNMDKGIASISEENISLVKEHYSWAKEIIAPNKGEYIIYLRTLASAQMSIAALNSIKPGLPAYVREAGMAFLSEIS